VNDINYRNNLLMKQTSRAFYNIILICLSLLTGIGVSVSISAEDQRSVEKNAQKKTKRNQHAQILNKLSEAQQAKLKKLQKENPEAFRKEIKILVKKYKSRHSKAAKQKEIDILVSKYHRSKDNTEKEQLLVQVKEKLTKQFNDKMVNNRRNVERTEERLNELKDQLIKRESNADKIIEERLRELKKDPHLRW
jgi:hypothetical protein